MQVAHYILDGRKIRSISGLYDELGRILGFPDYFGRNLDALWDVLSTDVEGPLELVWKNAEESKKSMGSDFEKVVALFTDLQNHRDDIKIIFE